MTSAAAASVVGLTPSCRVSIISQRRQLMTDTSHAPARTMDP